jgi:PPP family 3-phenylpropionic acid transporter
MSQRPATVDDPRAPSTARTPWARLSGAYFFYFAALGVLLPYFGPWLEWLGLDPARIGTVMAVFMGARVVAPLVAGHLADRSGRAAALVRGTSLLTALAFAGLFLGRSYGWLLFVSLTFSLSWSATLAPLEALTLGWLGEGTRRYGLVRLWGSVGFIAAVLALGPVFEGSGLSWLPTATFAIFVAAALAALTLPHARPVRRDGPPTSLGRVVRRPAVVALLVTAVLMQASHGPYYTFFSIYLRDHGYAETTVSALWALGVVAEIVAFVALTRHLRAGTARPLALVAIGLTALRWALVGSFVDQPVVLAFAQTLHAASYATFHAVVIHLIHRAFTGGNDVRGQALYGALSYGVGGALGSWTAGHAWTLLGPQETFHAAAALPLVALGVAFVWFGRED